MSISARESTLGELLWDASAYFVPVYQRDYSWDKEQTSSFWATVQAAAQEHTEYFLGSIVLVKTTAKQIFEVLDGQQRLATLTLLLAAFKNELVSAGYPAGEAVDMINGALNVMVGKVPDGLPLKKGHTSHMRLNDRDHGFFEDLVRGVQPSPQHKSHERMDRAFRFFCERIRRAVEPKNPWASVSDLWEDVQEALMDYLLYVRIEVGDIDTAQAVFESLNSAGLALTKADLIKNYLLMESQPQLRDALALWDRTVDALESLDLTSYVRAFCNSRFQFVRTDKLYAAVKTIAVKKPALTSQVTVNQFLKDLNRSSIAYASLATADPATWTDADVLRDLEDLRDLGATTALVPLLAAYHATATSDCPVSFKQVVSKFLTFHVRSIVVGPRTANEFEVQFSEWAVAMTRGTKSVADVLAELETKIVDDADFEADVKRLEVKRLKTARVLLARINDHTAPKIGQAPGGQPGLISATIRDGKKIHVEHVVPQTKTPYWTSVLEQDGLEHEKVVDMFGNLTLLTGSRNIQVSNGPFIDPVGRAANPIKLDKNAAYAHATGDINYALANATTFGKQELEARQAQLAAWAVATWPN